MLIKGPKGEKSINIGGIEYTAAPDGTVNISDPAHINAAQRDGWTEVPGVRALPDAKEE